MTSAALVGVAIGGLGAVAVAAVLVRDLWLAPRQRRRAIAELEAELAAAPAAREEAPA